MASSTAAANRSKFLEFRAHMFARPFGSMYRWCFSARKATCFPVNQKYPDLSFRFKFDLYNINVFKYHVSYTDGKISVGIKIEIVFIFRLHRRSQPN